MVKKYWFSCIWLIIGVFFLCGGDELQASLKVQCWPKGKKEQKRVRGGGEGESQIFAPIESAKDGTVYSGAPASGKGASSLVRVKTTKDENGKPSLESTDLAPEKCTVDGQENSQNPLHGKKIDFLQSFENGLGVGANGNFYFVSPDGKQVFIPRVFDNNGKEVNEPDIQAYSGLGPKHVAVIFDGAAQKELVVEEPEKEEVGEENKPTQNIDLNELPIYVDVDVDAYTTYKIENYPENVQLILKKLNENKLTEVLNKISPDLIQEILKFVEPETLESLLETLTVEEIQEIFNEKEHEDNEVRTTRIIDVLQAKQIPVKVSLYPKDVQEILNQLKKKKDVLQHLSPDLIQEILKYVDLKNLKKLFENLAVKQIKEMFERKVEEGEGEGEDARKKRIIENLVEIEVQVLPALQPEVKEIKEIKEEIYPDPDPLEKMSEDLKKALKSEGVTNKANEIVLALGKELLEKMLGWMKYDKFVALLKKFVTTNAAMFKNQLNILDENQQENYLRQLSADVIYFFILYFNNNLDLFKSLFTNNLNNVVETFKGEWKDNTLSYFFEFHENLWKQYTDDLKFYFVTAEFETKQKFAKFLSETSYKVKTFANHTYFVNFNYMVQNLFPAVPLLTIRILYEDLSNECFKWLFANEKNIEFVKKVLKHKDDSPLDEENSRVYDEFCMWYWNKKYEFNKDKFDITFLLQTPDKDFINKAFHLRMLLNQWKQIEKENKEAFFNKVVNFINFLGEEVLNILPKIAKQNLKILFDSFDINQFEIIFSTKNLAKVIILFQFDKKDNYVLFYVTVWKQQLKSNKNLGVLFPDNDAPSGTLRGKLEEFLGDEKNVTTTKKQIFLKIYNVLNSVGDNSKGIILKQISKENLKLLFGMLTEDCLKKLFETAFFGNGNLEKTIETLKTFEETSETIPDAKKNYIKKWQNEFDSGEKFTFLKQKFVQIKGFQESIQTRGLHRAPGNVLKHPAITVLGGGEEEGELEKGLSQVQQMDSFDNSALGINPKNFGLVAEDFVVKSFVYSPDLKVLYVTFGNKTLVMSFDPNTGKLSEPRKFLGETVAMRIDNLIPKAIINVRKGKNYMIGMYGEYVLCLPVMPDGNEVGQLADIEEGKEFEKFVLVKELKENTFQQLYSYVFSSTEDTKITDVKVFGQAVCISTTKGIFKATPTYNQFGNICYWNNSEPVQGITEATYGFTIGPDGKVSSVTTGDGRSAETSEKIEDVRITTWKNSEEAEGGNLLTVLHEMFPNGVYKIFTFDKENYQIMAAIGGQKIVLFQTDKNKSTPIINFEIKKNVFEFQTTSVVSCVEIYDGYYYIGCADGTLLRLQDKNGQNLLDNELQVLKDYSLVQQKIHLNKDIRSLASNGKFLYALCDNRLLQIKHDENKEAVIKSSKQFTPETEGFGFDLVTFGEGSGFVATSQGIFCFWNNDISSNLKKLIDGTFVGLSVVSSKEGASLPSGTLHAVNTSDNDSLGKVVFSFSFKENYEKKSDFCMLDMCLLDKFFKNFYSNDTSILFDNEQETVQRVKMQDGSWFKFAPLPYQLLQ
jgi:hypothetical protein